MPLRCGDYFCVCIGRVICFFCVCVTSVLHGVSCLQPVLPKPSAPHKVDLCVLKCVENERRPQCTITTKHIPFCPTASLAQTEMQALYVYQASPGKTADLGTLLGSF